MSRYALKNVAEEARDYFVTEQQYAVCTKAGADTVIHGARFTTELRPDWAVVSADATNGFNNIKRSAMLQLWLNDSAIRCRGIRN